VSAFGSLIRGISLRAAGALGLGGPADRGERSGLVSTDANASAGAPTGSITERDLRDRERELRILMSNWM
jgi:hypothetical protein